MICETKRKRRHKMQLGTHLAQFFSVERYRQTRIWAIMGFALAFCVLHMPSSYAQELPPYEMLVVGDSHISGQGLKEPNKFYFIVKEWIQNDVFGTSRKLNLKVKAHAGSRINLHPDEVKAMKKTGDDMELPRYAEANVSFPSIRMQIAAARAEYPDPQKVDLVMLSGCITDVLVMDIVSPFYKMKKLRERIRKFCGGSMQELLGHITATFPNAKVVVVGYAPIASRQSDLDTTARYFFKIIRFPPKLQFLATNPVMRQFLKPFRNKFAERSDVWLAESNREIRAAITKINSHFPEPRVFYVETPIKPESSYGTPKPMVWEVGPNHEPNDETYAERKAGCAKVFTEMKYKYYGRLSTRMCELSSIAHPNVAGSRAFAEPIKESLKKNVLLP
jgi:hypothetical protein